MIRLVKPIRPDLTEEAYNLKFNFDFVVKSVVGDGAYEPCPFDILNLRLYL